MKNRPPVLLVIAILMSLTFFRAQTLLMLPGLVRFGGEAPDAWLVPWVSDSVFGILVPFMVFLVLKGRSLRTWGLLVAYNALGAFDYVIGMATQWQHPLPEAIGSPAIVYTGIGIFLVFQVVAIVLLLRHDVIRHFSSTVYREGGNHD
jgi:D-alanyl-lipoteichoic acid acyltransferase DltB (MBOAT superfamily)